jgi:hypothetical protein
MLINFPNNKKHYCFFHKQDHEHDNESPFIVKTQKQMPMHKLKHQKVTSFSKYYFDNYNKFYLHIYKNICLNEKKESE